MFQIKNEQGLSREVETLTCLGLTINQSRVYFALTKSWMANVKTISQKTRIARQDIYRIMRELQNLGLVEKIINKPTMYKAISLKDGLSSLLQSKTQEHTEIQKKTIELLSNVHNDTYKKILQDENQQFRIISSRKLLIKKITEKDNGAQTSINVIGEWKFIKFVLYHRLQDFKRILERGVKIRIIVEKPEDIKSMQKLMQFFGTTALLKIRYISAPIPVKTVIFDDTEVFLLIAMQIKNDVPSLWSNNCRFAKIMTAYFEELWNTALYASKTSVRKSIKPK